MHPSRPLTLAIATMCLGCVSMPAADDTVATYVLVRHAEKDATIADDPPLTAMGEARAQRLADGLRRIPLDAIYSTAYRRTRDTAAPVAASHGLPVLDYAAADAASFAQRLRREHPRGTVLVVGHSNTVPQLARALCACDVPDMDEATYGIRYTLRFDANGKPRLAGTRD